MAGRLLLLVVCLLAMVTAKAEIASGDGWTLSDEGELTVTKNISKDLLGDYPWYDNRASIKNVVFAEEVTVIGANALYGCEGLTSVTIPEGVTEIGVNPFWNCENIASIKVDANNKKYDSRGDCNAIIETESNKLVSGCQNTTIPEDVVIIGERAFRGCSQLGSIAIPEGVTEIGSYAFSGCSQLTSIVIPEGVTEIGINPFISCANLTSIKVDANNKKYDSRGGCNAIIETESNTLVAGCQNTKIPEDVVSIGISAFSGCSSLTDIVIPDGVTSIGNSAFNVCSRLTSVVIPEGVTSIGDHTFRECKRLKNVTIPEGVTIIGNDAFYWCSSLTNVTIPESVMSIGDYAFYGCASLTYIVSLSVNPPKIFKYSLTSYTRTVYVHSSAVEVYKKASVWKNHKIVAIPKVTFVDWNDEVLKEEEVVYAQDATAPEAPTREGYDFTGWNGTYTNVTSDVTVKAEYKAKEFTVNFVDWDESEIKTEKVLYAQDATAPEEPTREGYDFTGWNGTYTDVRRDVTVKAEYEKRAVVTGGKMITREEEGAWYDLTGKEYDTKPTKRGVYIHGGKMLIVK